MKKALAIMMIVALAMTAVFAQGSKEEAKSDIKVALIVSSTIDDKGWCQAMHDGIVEAMEEMPGKIADYKAVENTQPGRHNDSHQNIRQPWLQHHHCPRLTVQSSG